MSDGDVMWRHLSYLWCLLRHKACVGWFCVRRGLWWAAVMHDWTRFLPGVWGPYAEEFFGRDGRRLLRYDDRFSDGFKRAWLRHHREGHHWEAWCVVIEGGVIESLDMPERFVAEMVCDWRGGRVAEGFDSDCRSWWELNRESLMLSPSTEVLLEGEVSEWGWG